MADTPAKKRKITRAKQQTVRERATSTTASAGKPRRLKRTVKAAARPLHAARRVGAKEYYLPLPDNKVGRFLNKKRRATPRYFLDAWRELRQVTWPNRRETFKLTVAVFTFAIVFGLLVALVDYGLDQLFKRFILG